LKLLNEKDPVRYPKAQPFYTISSFGYTWREFLRFESQQGSFSFSGRRVPTTDLQRWVMELEMLSGECRVQSLMEHASKHGFTLGKFYELFTAEIEAGSLKQDEDGRVGMTS
jgi:hypothetical protein